MKSLTVISNFPLPSISKIREFEELNNLILPNDYIDFLMTQNVFTVEESYFVDDANNFEVHHIYPFSDEAELSIPFINERLRDFFQNKYFPFADDSGGGQFVISLQNLDYGKVYFCRMDEELGKGLTYLTESLTDFINGMQRIR